MSNHGWIPPSSRTRPQLMMTEEFHERIGIFEDLATTVQEPDRVLFGVLEKETLGRMLWRVWQKSGSCVGAASAVAQPRAALGDVVHRGDNEEVKEVFPWAPYGVGREIAGLNGPGDGSFGGAQAKAVTPDYFGILPWDHPGMPQPTVTDGWAVWGEKTEIQWSWPRNWPVKKDDLAKDAKPFGLSNVTKITTVEGIVQALTQGYSVTQASLYGTRPQVKEDVLVGPWNTEWAHQMELGGFWKHPKLGLLIEDDNQWGPTVHGDCPTLAPLGIRGSFWITKDTMAKIISSRDSELYAHSATGGFPPQNIKWNTGWDSIVRYE